MKENLMDKQTAASILGDEIYDLNFELEKTTYVMQEITDEYFRRFDIKNKEDEFKILYEYKRCAAYAEIVEDLLYKLQNTAEQLQKYKEDGCIARTDLKEAKSA